MKTKLLLAISLVLLLFFPANFAGAHCDTMDGPTIADAKKAIAQNNINYALKWVQATYENEIKQLSNSQ
mgnify:FL=1